MAQDDTSHPEDDGSFLPLDAYAVTYHSERGFGIHLPRSVAGQQDVELPDTVTALLACATRLANDPEFVQAQVAWMKE